MQVLVVNPGLGGSECHPKCSVQIHLNYTLHGDICGTLSYITQHNYHINIYVFIFIVIIIAL